jgi:hypothetical protein
MQADDRSMIIGSMIVIYRKRGSEVQFAIGIIFW